MRISLNWLRELVDISLTPEELAQTLTIAGFEVEDIEDRRRFADGVVVGKVLECQAHPNADKLRVCQVNIGQPDPSTIVCGASNVCADAYVPVATLGTYLPAIDLKLRSTKLRGVRSEGMICSLSELGLAKESAGIHIFPDAKLQPGDDVRPLLGLDDVILDLTATANRADALSMVGVAREVAALTGASLRLPSIPTLSVPEGDRLNLKIADAHACPAYIGTVIEGIKIASSPNWLKWRLLAAGVRPINNVVDVTNYILLEWGQPLHAFDRERLQAVAGEDDLTIGVRYAKEGESLKTLDDQTRSLGEQNLLITAGDSPVALAGIMGGEATEVHSESENLVLEAALFHPVVIRRSSRSQSLRTEASTRYERSVNQAELEAACNRAVALIVQLAGGKPIARAIADARPDLSQQPPIKLRLERIRQILGSVRRGETIGEIEASDVEQILTALGCKLAKFPENSDVWSVRVPPYRYRDLEREIDLIEEVARLYGYDHFCDELPDKAEPGYLSETYRLRNSLRSALRAEGLTEVVHYSLVKPEADEVVVANPLFTEYSALRTNLIDGMIDAFAYNQSQGNGALNAFEVGRIFWREADGVGEADAVAGILGGDYLPEGAWIRGGKESPMSWYEAKGILASVFEYLGVAVEYRSEQTDPRLHPGRTAALWVDGQRLGTFGQLHPQLRQKQDLPDAVYVFELSFEVLLAASNREEIITARFQPYSTYPAVERDLAFFAPIEISVAQIEQVMHKAGKALLERVNLFDQYQGKNVPEGERSLAFSLFYRGSDRTLTDEEVEPVHQKIRQALVDKFKVTLRS